MTRQSSWQARVCRAWCGWIAVTAALACALDTDQRVHIVRRFPTAEATQAVAVDAGYFYAIGNAAIGKYDKQTGRRAAGWEGKPGGPVAHLNSGIVFGTELFCAHSNYPETPMVSSIEVFDTTSMRHLRSIPLPSDFGSATWVERTDGEWWVAFAHYAGRGGVPGKGPEHTRLVRFDRNWKPASQWSFPPAVVERWDGMSSSGGAWIVPGRRLATTGHHARELYVLDIPDSGTELALVRRIEMESEGQGIALDPTDRTSLYSIQRRSREVIVSRIPRSL